MYKKNKSVIDAPSLSTELCSALVHHCNNVYKLLGNQFKKDFYIWTLFFELQNLGFNYQLCGKESGMDLYPDMLKINCTSSESIYLIVKVKAEGQETEEINEHTLPLISGSTPCLVVHFGYNEFKYKFI